MTWFKVCDSLPFHRKVLRAGNAAMGAWVRMGAQSGRMETDGRLTTEEANAIGTAEEIAKLIEVELLEAIVGGYEMHDFLIYNPSSKALKKQRKTWKERKAGQRAVSHVDTLSCPPVSPTGSPGRVGTGRSGPDPEASEPYSQTVAIAPNVTLHTSDTRCERIWEEMWRVKYGRPYVWLANTGAKGDVRQLHDVWLMAMGLGTITEPIFTHWVKEYLRDGDPFVTEKSHPVWAFVQRVNQYGLPGQKPASGKAPYHRETREEPPSGIHRSAAEVAELAAKVAGIGRGR